MNKLCFDRFILCHTTSNRTACLHCMFLIAGLCLEGARWDKEDGVLKESLPNQLHPALPVIQVCNLA